MKHFIYHLNRVYVRGHKYVLGPTQTYFKMSLRRAQNIFMPKNINSITLNITLEGIEKIKTEKNDNKTLFYSPALRENVNKL